MRLSLASRTFHYHRLLILVLLGPAACSSAEEGDLPGTDSDAVVSDQDAVGSSSGGDPGVSEPFGTGGIFGGGGDPGTAPMEGTGGAPPAPVDCGGIASAGYELCNSTADTCGAVFADSSGCSAVCAAAGLECQTAFENVENACAADMALPPLGCDSGHQSDYCQCGRPASGSGSSASGGAKGSGGTPGAGGSNAGDPSDCNTNSDHPIIEVNKAGSGDFTKVQDAIDSLPGSNSTPTIIRIAPGSYYEKLRINVPNITLCGQVGAEASTLLTYSDGADTSNGNGGTVGTSGSASVELSASDVSVENLTIENTRGVGSQAVALLVSGQRVQFKNSRFIGNQDTVYVKGGSQYFRDCYVEGTVDFIFGGATAVFDECTIHNVGGGSAVTAPSTDEGNPFGIVFLGGELTAAGGVNAKSVNLGRNWRPYGSTTYIQTTLGAHITSGGWIPMGDNSLSTARFSEYQSTGPGANAGGRVADSDQLSASEAAAFTVDNIFGSWDPTYAP